MIQLEPAARSVMHCHKWHDLYWVLKACLTYLWPFVTMLLPHGNWNPLHSIRQIRTDRKFKFNSDFFFCVTITFQFYIHFLELHIHITTVFLFYNKISTYCQIFHFVFTLTAQLPTNCLKSFVKWNKRWRINSLLC